MVASILFVSFSWSFQMGLAFWLDRERGVQYPVVVQTPKYKIDSMESLEYTPLTAAPVKTGEPQLLANVATVSREVGPTNVTHYNIAPTVDVQLGVDGADLGSVASSVGRIVDEMHGSFPRGTSVAIAGQAESMRASFLALAAGMVLAVVLVYLLMEIGRAHV